MIGTKFAHYEITSHLGTGGMGEVYQATDAKLGRSVAIKLLPEAFTHDHDRAARFEREARVLASLNHPNIAAIYGIEESGGRKFLVMEMVGGETLAEKIKRGAIPIDEAIGIMKEIAEGLEAAHEKGIVHRDLKPANVKIAPDGRVKILDFGLAKAYEAEAANTSLSNSPTLSNAATQAGVILGTAAYMSPEQARGKTVDRRTDIWAFGVVFYELLTGRCPFRGEDVSEILASVLKDEPQWDVVTFEARRLLRKCLAKNPKDRLRDIGDALALLDETSQSNRQVIAVIRKPKLPWILAAFGITAALILGYVSYFGAAQEQPREVSLSLLAPNGKDYGRNSLLAISTDGRRMAFVASAAGEAEGSTAQLWIRDLDSLTAKPLAGTNGASFPFWSPDGKNIGFFAEGKLKRIDTEGAPAIELANAVTPLGGSWSKNDIIIFHANAAEGLLRISAANGSASPATHVDPGGGEAAHVFPWFLPDGRHYLYTALNRDPRKSIVYLADLDSPDDSKTRRKVLTALSNVVYSAGFLLFVSERTLLAQRFDAENAKIIGDAVPIAKELDYRAGGPDAVFSASQNGTLLYEAGSPATEVQLTWFDHSGKKTGTLGAPASQLWPAISKDGTMVIVDRRDRARTGFLDLVLFNLAQGNFSRFTANSDSYNNSTPQWAPDEIHVAFSSSQNGAYGVYQRAIGSTAPDELLDHDALPRRVTDWSRDGNYIIEEVTDPLTKGDIWILPRSGDLKSYQYIHTDADETRGKVSPNGLWMAYTSNESKRSEIYVQSFPKPGNKRKVSVDGGRFPVWSRDGKQLFFFDLKNSAIMAVSVNSGPNFESSTPQALFNAPQAGTGSGFDVDKDGRFLVPVQPENSEKRTITVVLNWQAGLKK